MTEKTKLPKYLYKYRSWSNPNHKRIITDREIWFASPRSFNDPFDCRISLQYRDLTVGQLVEYHMDLHNNLDVSSEEIAKYVKEANNWATHLLAMPDDEYEQSMNLLQRGRDALTGIFTASFTHEDILMWSHYSDAHTGFCVAFDTERLVIAANEYKGTDYIILPHQVEYPDHYPRLLPLAGSDNDAWLKRNIVKSKQWKYEKEWRLITFSKTDFMVQLGAGIITKVILGCEMPDSDQEAVIHELLKLGGRIALEKAVKSKDKFGLEFLPVDY